MKKILTVIFPLTLTLLLLTPVYADSPITSTDFYTAYLDVEIVNTAESEGIVNSEIAKYLSSPENPIDVKAAVINALGWDFEGKSNADGYAKLVFGKSVKDLDLNNLSGDQLFCLGYLMAMDDYFNVDNAIPILEKANSKMADSLTVSLITAVVKAQKAMDDTENWNEVWELVAGGVIYDKDLKQDLRPEAGKIIFDYMSLYSDEPVTDPYSIVIDPPSITVDEGKSLTVSIIGGEAPYRLNNHVPEAELTISGNTLTAEGLKAGLAQVTISDKNNKSAVLPILVNPPAGENNIEILLYPGDPYMTVNGVRSEIDPGRGTKPVIIKNTTFLPARALVEAMGGVIGWDKAENKATIRLGSHTIELWVGKNAALVDGLNITTNAAPQIINSRTMLPVRFISENLGFAVGWDDKTRRITVAGPVQQAPMGNSAGNIINRSRVALEGEWFITETTAITADFIK